MIRYSSRLEHYAITECVGVAIPSTRGDLPEQNQYNIFCPLMGGPDYKMNYLASSCAERVLIDTCGNKLCQRYEKIKERL